jgi:hypothetical protein
MLPKFSDIEKGIGGRPIGEKKQRLSYYLSAIESQKLKEIAYTKDIPVSMLVRALVKKLIDEEGIANE